MRLQDMWNAVLGRRQQQEPQTQMPLPQARPVQEQNGRPRRPLPLTPPPDSHSDAALPPDYQSLAGSLQASESSAPSYTTERLLPATPDESEQRPASEYSETRELLPPTPPPPTPPPHSPVPSTPRPESPASQSSDRSNAATVGGSDSQSTVSSTPRPESPSQWSTEVRINDVITDEVGTIPTIRSNTQSPITPPGQSSVQGR
jgi:hypothetical protein